LDGCWPQWREGETRRCAYIGVNREKSVERQRDERRAGGVTERERERERGQWWFFVIDIFHGTSGCA